MKDKYQLLFRAMVTDIKNCKKVSLSEWDSTKACFWIVKKYWEKLKILTKNGVFNNEKEEIDFFRNVKPQFSGYTEYFILLSTGILFMPTNATESIPLITERMKIDLQNDTIIFWEREEKRFKLFCMRNENFINYYRGGQRDKDNNYFLRKNNCFKYQSTEQLYDSDKNFRSSYGHLIEMYMAHKLYNNYVHEKLDHLKSHPMPSYPLPKTIKTQLKSSYGHLIEMYMAHKQYNAHELGKFDKQKSTKTIYKYLIGIIKTHLKRKLLKRAERKFNHNKTLMDC